MSGKPFEETAARPRVESTRPPAAGPEFPQGSPRRKAALWERIRQRIEDRFLPILNIASYRRLRAAELRREELESELAAAQADRERSFLESRTIVTRLERSVEELRRALADREAKLEGMRRTVSEHDVTIRELHQSLEERDRRAAELARVVAERDNAIVELRHAAIERERSVEELARVVAERDNAIAELQRAAIERERSVEELARVVTTRDNAIAKLQRAAIERDRSVEELGRVVTERDAAIAELQRAAIERERSVEEVGRVVTERDNAIAELQRAAIERERSVEELGRVVADRDRTIYELGQTVADRERSVAELTQGTAAAERDRVASELERLESAATQLAAASEQIRATVSELPVPATARASRAGALLDQLRKIGRGLVDFSGIHRARQLLTEHYSREDDHNLPELLAVYDQAAAEGLPYWDIRTAARILSSVLKPATYLEVGTRRGWSLAQVFAECPEVQAYVFEDWTADYGGAEQGNPDYIRRKMQEVVGPGGTPRIEFISGNSHDTLPEFFSGSSKPGARATPRWLDLIAVDGDHTRLGAWWDLIDLFPRVRLGGALVFDDLDYAGDEEAGLRATSRFDRPSLPPHIRSLMDVWLAVQSLHPDFVYFTSTRLRFRAGIAVRIR